MPKLHHLFAAAVAALCALAWPVRRSRPRGGRGARSAGRGASALSTGVPVTTVPLRAGRFVVFGVGQDGHVHGRTWRGTEWARWGVVGRPVAAALSTAAPVAAVPGAGDRFVVFATGQDGRLYRRSYNGARWSGWKTVGRAVGRATEPGRAGHDPGLRRHHLAVRARPGWRSVNALGHPG